MTCSLLSSSVPWLAMAVKDSLEASIQRPDPRHAALWYAGHRGEWGPLPTGLPRVQRHGESGFVPSSCGLFAISLSHRI
jgi:hypothetical protein